LSSSATVLRRDADERRAVVGFDGESATAIGASGMIVEREMRGNAMIK